MSVVAGVEVELSGDMLDSIPCEHFQHGDYGAHHIDLPASHYLSCLCPKCGIGEDIFAACPAFVYYARSDGRLRCFECHHVGPANTFCRVLGRVPRKGL